MRLVHFHICQTVIANSISALYQAEEFQISQVADNVSGAHGEPCETWLASNSGAAGRKYPQRSDSKSNKVWKIVELNPWFIVRRDNVSTCSPMITRESGRAAHAPHSPRSDIPELKLAERHVDRGSDPVPPRKKPGKTYFLTEYRSKKAKQHC